MCGGQTNPTALRSLEEGYPVAKRHDLDLDRGGSANQEQRLTIAETKAVNIGERQQRPSVSAMSSV